MYHFQGNENNVIIYLSIAWGPGSEKGLQYTLLVVKGDKIGTVTLEKTAKKPKQTNRQKNSTKSEARCQIRCCTIKDPPCSKAKS